MLTELNCAGLSARRMAAEQTARDCDAERRHVACDECLADDFLAPELARQLRKNRAGAEDPLRDPQIKGDAPQRRGHRHAALHRRAFGEARCLRIVGLATYPAIMTKLPPIPARDAGGSFSISNPDDGTPIREMFVLGGDLLLITDKCTY